MPKQRYDNEAVQRSRKKIHELVKKGHRLNPSKASGEYHRAVIKSSPSAGEKRKSRKELRKRATGGNYNS